MQTNIIPQRTLVGHHAVACSAKACSEDGLSFIVAVCELSEPLRTKCGVLTAITHISLYSYLSPVTSEMEGFEMQTNVRAKGQLLLPWSCWDCPHTCVCVRLSGMYC